MGSPHPRPRMCLLEKSHNAIVARTVQLMLLLLVHTGKRGAGNFIYSNVIQFVVLSRHTPRMFH